MSKKISALASAIAASLGTAGVAEAAQYTAVLTQVNSYSNNGSSAAVLTSSTATFQYDDVSGLLTQTGGTYIAQYRISPTTLLFRHSIDGLVIGNAAAASATAYTCTEGNFGGSVGASLCGNYNFGANQFNESTVSWGPGTATARTLGGDDMALGPQQSIAQNDGYTLVSLTPGAPGTLVLTNRACVNSPSNCSGLPDDSNSGYTWTLSITELVPAAVDDTASTRLNVPVDIDVLANDTLFENPVTLLISSGASAGGSAEIFNGGVPCTNPCTGDPSELIIRHTPNAALGTATYIEQFNYLVTDGGEGAPQVGAIASVTVNNAVPVAGDTTIDIDTQGVDPSTVTGTVNAGTLAGNSLGDAPAVVTKTDGATGTAAVAGNVVTYTPANTFFAGTDNFTYTITDTDTENDTGTVTVNIADEQPVLDDDSAETEVDEPVDVELLPLTTPGNGSPAQHTFGVETDAANGNCAVAGSTLTYTPDAGYVGDDSCEVFIEDGDGDADFADIDITVSEPSSGGGDGLREDDGGSSADLLMLSLLGGSALIRRRRRDKKA